MAIYLVDYENTNASGLTGIENLGKGDTVYIFYSAEACSLTFKVHEQITQSEADTKLMEVTCGTKNSLDFQLTTFLGWLIGKNLGDEYYIVSRDNGFKSTAEFWSDRKTKVGISFNLAGESRGDMEKQLQKLIPRFSKDIPTVLGFLEKYKTKQGFNNALTKQYGSEKTGEIYKAVKPLLSGKKGK